MMAIKAPSLIGLWVIAVLAVLILGGCTMQDSYQGKVILEGVHVLAANATLDGDLVVIDGEATVPATARVNGTVYLLGGTARINGAVDGDVVMVLGRLVLGETGLVAGKLTYAGGSLTQDPGAQIQGGVDRGVALNLAEVEDATRSQGSIGGSILQALFAAALAWLLASYGTAPLDRVQTALRRHPLICTAMGGLTGLVLPALLVFMAFTIVPLPLVLLLSGVVLLALLYGWIGVGAALGRHLLSGSTRLPWLGTLSVPQQTFVGTLVLMLIAAALNRLPGGGVFLSVLNAAGLGIVLLISASGLGAVVLTRLGLRTFVPQFDAYRTELPD